MMNSEKIGQQFMGHIEMSKYLLELSDGDPDNVLDIDSYRAYIDIRLANHIVTYEAIDRGQGYDYHQENE